MATRPVVIVGAPRSGTTVLQRCLAAHPDVWHLDGESHSILEGPFHPGRRGFESNRLTADDATGPEVDAILRGFAEGASNLNLVTPWPERFLARDDRRTRVARRIAHRAARRAAVGRRAAGARFLEKTPKNSLRVPFLEAVFDKPLFLFVRREPRANIRSIRDGWLGDQGAHRPRFGRYGYPVAGELGLRDHHDDTWRFALVPGWRSLRGAETVDVAAWQYLQCNRIALDDLRAVEPERVFHLPFSEFLHDPTGVMEDVQRWAGLAPSRRVTSFTRSLPKVNASDALPVRAGDEEALDRVIGAHAAALCSLAEVPGSWGRAAAHSPDGQE